MPPPPALRAVLDLDALATVFREASEGKPPTVSVPTGEPHAVVPLNVVMREGAVARHGYPVLVDGQESGVVTSGTASPTLDEKIAMAYVPAAAAAPGGEVDVVVRERPYRAEQVKLPFYRRPRPEAG